MINQRQYSTILMLTCVTYPKLLNLFCADLRTKQRSDRENLTLATHPIKTFYLFILATAEYLKGSSLYILKHFGLLVFLTVLVVAGGAVLLLIDGPHEKVSCFL